MRIGSGIGGAELLALNNLNRAFNSLAETSVQLATLQRVQRGSDDPAAAAAIDAIEGDLLALQNSGAEPGTRDAEEIALTSALSELRDVDVAETASRLVRDRIVARAAIAAVGITLHNRELVLGLLERA